MNGEATRGNGVFALGAGVTLLGLMGYVVGLVAVYPGRAFSVTAVMAGITLAAIGNAMRREAEP